MPSRLEIYIQQAGQLAQKMGIASVVIAARDPATGEARVVASPAGLEDLRDPVAKKYGFDSGALGDAADAEASWPSSY